MRSKKGVKEIILIFILIGVIYAVFPAIYGSYGIAASCDAKKIIGIARIPPPLMCMACIPTGCDVNVQATYNDTIICSGKSRADIDKTVVPCNGITKYKGKEITATADFYVDENKIGSDTKRLTVP